MFKIKTKRWGKLEVFFTHAIPKNGKYVLSSGTGCYIDNETEYPLSEGRTFIHPLDANNYCKETGRKLALTRALKNLDATRPERTEFWKAYFASKKKGINDNAVL